jgi:hypothetical protein
VYTKDFASLLQLLDISQQSGTLFVEREGEAWQARLQLREGELLSCFIVGVPDGHLLLSGTQAVDWLSRRGELQWRLEELQKLPESSSDVPSRPSPGLPQGTRQQGLQPPYPSMPSAPRASRLIPRRIGQPANIFLWSRDTRHVFALIDGVRSLEEIAALLRKSPEEVFPLFRELAASGFIRIEEHP